ADERRVREETDRVGQLFHARELGGRHPRLDADPIPLESDLRRDDVFRQIARHPELDQALHLRLRQRDALTVAQQRSQLGLCGVSELRAGDLHTRFVRGEAPPHREDPVSLVPCQRDRADHEQECEQSSHAASEQSQHSPIPLQPTDRLYPSGTDAIRSYRAPAGDRWLCIRSISRTWTRACAPMWPRIVSSARNSPAPASRTVRPSVMWGWNARSSRSKPSGANAHSRSCLRPRSGGEASTPSQRTRGRRSDGNAPIPPTC